MELKECIDCKVKKELKFFKKSFDGSKYKNRCHACYARRYRNKLKYDFLLAYGKVCSCCSEDDFRFLTLDHVNNDGNLHRETLKEHQILAIARKENYPKDKYTILCFNCNSGRSCNGGICPHKCDTKEVAWNKLERDTQKIGRIHVQYNVSNLPQAREVLKTKRLENFVSKLSQEEILQMIQSLQKE